MTTDQPSNEERYPMAGDQKAAAAPLAMVKNGDKTRQETMRPLSQSRRDKIAASLAAFQEADQEREDLRRDLDAMTLRFTGAQTELEGMRGNHLRMQTELHAMRVERDYAVRKHQEVEILMKAVYDLIGTRLPKSVIEDLHEGNVHDAGDGGAADGADQG